MAGKAEKAAALIRDGGRKAKAAATKVYVVAKDPETQARAGKLLADGKRIYRVATSPEAKETYRKVGAVIDKIRKR